MMPIRSVDPLTTKKKFEKGMPVESFSIMRVADAPVELRNGIFYLPRQIGISSWVKAMVSNGLPITDILLVGRQAEPGECNFAEVVPARARIVTSKLPFPWYFFSTAYWASRQEIDVLYAMLPCPTAALSLILPGRARIKVGLLVGYPDHSLKIKYRGVLGFFIGKVSDWLTRFGLKRTDITLFLSNALKEKYAKTKEKVLVIPDSKYLQKDVRTPVLCPVHQPPRVMYAGRLSPEKGLEVLLNSLDPEWELWVAGAGPLEEKVRTRGKCFGWVSLEQLWELLRQVDVLVLPSYTEGLGNVLLDAMMNGIPVVGSSVGGIPEVLRNGRAGVLVPPGQPDALREAIKRILHDDELRKKIIMEGHKVACAYALDVALSPLVDAIKELHAQK